jgi:hypothetical protein
MVRRTTDTSLGTVSLKGRWLTRFFYGAMRHIDKLSLNGAGFVRLINLVRRIKGYYWLLKLRWNARFGTDEQKDEIMRIATETAVICMVHHIIREELAKEFGGYSAPN